ncbi:hypothetical protein SISSUDRAFT_995916 [Sistotremastrum suecicum HHB10207 ss-3]|uniref:Nucleosome assembly protein n=1 Tax=Sistotremastrum suecicum HHB10207 ss-3 TaxID=1314776 RepID=A0A166J8N0_9AGAM|nr:hypothetical protein SISSUDRAFT_995916 [Sistotremastrum suecicum HHB10207 ss-3]
MSGKKRAAGDEEAKPLATEVDLTDEQVQVLEGVEKMLNKAQTVLALRAYKFMVPKFAQRREALKKIPGFWSRALLRHGLVALHTQHTADQDALSYLEDIWVERDQTELRAFKIEFHFKENPYFEEKVLVKEFKYVAPPSTSTATDEDGLTEAQVDFNEERDLAPQTITITWKTDSKNLTKLHPRVADDEDDMPAEPGSFFNFFTVAEDPFEVSRSPFFHWIKLEMKCL